MLDTASSGPMLMYNVIRVEVVVFTVVVAAVIIRIKSVGSVSFKLWTKNRSIAACATGQALYIVPLFVYSFVCHVLVATISRARSGL